MVEVQKQRVRVKAGSQPSTSAAYFRGESMPFLASWQPTLREPQADVSTAWVKAAARSVESLQNSGFIKGIVEISTGAVVGAGLRMASRPDTDALGWTPERGQKFARDFERYFRTWARKPVECDAAGQMNFGQMQQVLYAAYLVYGEGLGFAPMFTRNGGNYLTKLLLIPPARLENETSEYEGVYSGVKVDGYGFPLGYKIKVRGSLGWETRGFDAYDQDGRPLVFLIKDPILGSTRGMPVFASVMTPIRQYDQVFNAVVTKKLTQAVFAATLKTKIDGLAAFDGLFTDKDRTELDTGAFATAKGQWYDGAKLDLQQHGRVAHLFPNDELDFVETKGPGELQDKVNEWLLREICQGASVSYETGTGDFRGATYSSIRMGGAIEWMTVLRRRANIIVPFCEMAAGMVLEEGIGRGKIDYPGGYEAFKREREFVSRTTWTGPARPQADDYKTAKAFEVRKSVGVLTLAEAHGEYGTDWDDDARQKAAENALYQELGLPLPWSPETMLETKEGQDAELQTPNDPKQNNNRDPKKSKTGGVRDPADKTDPQGSDDLATALEKELGTDLEAGLEGENDGD